MAAGLAYSPSMDRLRVLSARDLLDGDHAFLEMPEPLMWGDNFRFEHQDPEVQALRSAVRISCGEYDFTVSCMPREHAPDVDFTRVIANELRRRYLASTHDSELALSAEGRFQFRDHWHRRLLFRAPPLEEAVALVDSLPHRAPVDVLWDFANFGCLMWWTDWRGCRTFARGCHAPKWRS
jgi:hypothetical protein